MPISPEVKAKKAVIAELKKLKVDHNEGASLEDLQGLLESSKAAAAPAAPEASPDPVPAAPAPEAEPESGEKKKKGPATGLFVVIRRSADHSFEVYSNDLDLPAGALLIHPACSQEEAGSVMSRQQVHLKRR